MIGNILDFRKTAAAASRQTPRSDDVALTKTRKVWDISFYLPFEFAGKRSVRNHFWEGSLLVLTDSAFALLEVFLHLDFIGPALERAELIGELET
jgi:hypothetical protein